MITLGKEFGKFLAVGVFSTIINYCAFYILFKIFGVFYIASSIFGFLCGVFAGYQFNKKWTFSVVKSNKNHAFAYFCVYVCSLIVGVACLKALVEGLNFMPEIANFLMICLTTMTNFIGVKFVVFRK